MKRIEALIPHDRIQDVGRALTQSGVKGLTLTTVYTPSDQRQDDSARRKNRLLGKPCCKLDVLVSNEEFARIQSVLLESAGSDARLQIFVVDLETTIRIRTGESQEAALA